MRFSTPCLLAFDLGTNGCKGALVDDEGLLVNEKIIDFPTITLESGYFEQDPSMWWEAVKEITKKCVKKVKPENIVGVGFCGTMGAALPVDKGGMHLRNSMLYADMRAIYETNELLNHFDKEELYYLTGNPVSPVYSLSKWMWIKKHEPNLFEKTFKFIQPKDYLVHRLTGELTTDYVDASATMAFDIKKRVWSDELLTCAGVPLDKMPEPKPSTNIAGEITSEAAHELGLVKGTPVIVGCGDTAALLAGAGAVRSRFATINLGSAAEINVTTEKPLFISEVMVPLRCHAVPEKWFSSASAMTSGTALKWFMTQFSDKTESYKEMDKKSMKIKPGSNGLIFLPHLSGERVPIWDPKARGAFIGLSTLSSKTHCYRAILEGVAFSLRAIMEVYKKNGADFKEVSLSGGGSESELWKQIIIDVLGFQCSNLEKPQGASALGVAVYIDAALNREKTIEKISEKIVKLKGLILPLEENMAKYDKLYNLYSRCYPSLADIMHQLVDYSEI